MLFETWMIEWFDSLTTLVTSRFKTLTLFIYINLWDCTTTRYGTECVRVCSTGHCVIGTRWLNFNMPTGNNNNTNLRHLVQYCDAIVLCTVIK